MGTGRAPRDLVAEPLSGEDLRGDLLPLSGAGRLDPTMAPTAWKMALSRSPPPGAASKAREPCEIGFAAVAAACVRRRRCQGRAAPRHRASRVRRPGFPA